MPNGHTGRSQQDVEHKGTAYKITAKASAALAIPAEDAGQRQVIDTAGDAGQRQVIDTAEDAGQRQVIDVTMPLPPTPTMKTKANSTVDGYYGYYGRLLLLDDRPEYLVG
jgi:hypothetical protein